MTKTALLGLLLTTGSLWTGAEYRGSNCKQYQNLAVCNLVKEGALLVVDSASVGGSLIVAGLVTAASYNTPAGPLFSGVRNRALLSNITGLENPPYHGNALWTATAAGNVSSGISVNTSTGVITLPAPGLFLVQYTARYESIQGPGSDSSTAQLQQTITGPGTQINITQPAITVNSTLVSAASDPATPVMSRLSTGSAFIRTTSSLNNQINLFIQGSSGESLITTTPPDANVQMWIVQLN